MSVSFAQFPALPTTWRSSEDPGARHRQSGQAGGKGLSTLCNPITSYRRGDSVKDSAVGRDAKFGFEALQVFGTSPYFLAEHQVPAQERACVQCEPARCDRLLSRSLEQPRTRPPGQIPPISPPSWRGIP